MSEHTWERLGAATGIVSIVLFVAAFMFGDDPPDVGETTAGELTRYFEGTSQLRFSTLLIALATFFLLWFLGSIRSTLFRAEGAPARLTSIFFAAGIITVTTYFVSWGIASQGLIEDAARTDPDVARTLIVTGEAAFGPIGIGTLARAAMLGAAALVALRFGGLPKWLGWFGGIVALGSFVGVFTIIESDPTEGPLGGVWFFSWLAWALWILIASIVLVSRRQSEPAAPAG